MAREKQPAIVAELGRPETPEETAARRAEYSRKRRSNHTVLSLVIAMVASLGVVLLLVLVVVRPSPAPDVTLDYRETAAQAQTDSDVPLIAPPLPPGWYANDARLETTAQVPTWYIGLITPTTQFIALNQGIDANPSWQAAVLDGATPTASTTIDGIAWAIYDRRDVEDPGNYAYSMSAELEGSTVVLHGTAVTEEFELLAAAIAAELGAP